MKNLQETFTYDDMNRLTGITLKRSSGQDLHCGVSYDALDRMTSKQAVTAVNGTPQVSSVFSQPAFDATKVHALASAQSMSDLFPTTAQTVTYTGFDKADKIKQGNNSLSYTYGYDHQRIFMEEHVGSTVRTKRYVGNCEYVTETTGNTTASRWLTYLTGSTGVYAVVVTANNANTIHYILKDNLGSWTAITSSSGTVEQRLSYDAWGNLRNPNSWSGSFTGTPMFDRGFTGHEHLYAFGLINMNGRMYDPITSSFLSVDQYVGSPENAQGFNRHAYCSNNPLRYVDPSGWLQVGGGASGYTPNSSANANDPYAYAEHGSLLEPRDVGKRQFDTSDPVITWMEENSLHGGGKGGGQLSEPTQVADGEDPPEGATVHTGNSIFFKAFWHYQFGNKEDYWIDASTLYFGFITQKELSYEKDGTATINLYDYFEAGEYALALGKISLKPVGNNLFEIQSDDYNFNIEWQFGWNKRNIATAASGFIHGPVIDDVPIPTHWMGGKPCYAQPSVYWGGPFKFRFSNYVYIKP